MSKLIFSSTLVETKHDSIIQERVRAMGGEFYHRMSRETTYLVVGNPWSDKFKRAIDKGVKLITVEGLEAAYNSWVGGGSEAIDEINLRLMKPFEKQLICLSNLDEDSKMGYAKEIGSNGGLVSSVLTTRCTILVSPVDGGRKVAAARNWDIPVVSPKWIKDSIGFGITINPSLYSINDPDAPQMPPVIGKPYTIEVPKTRVKRLASSVLPSKRIVSSGFSIPSSRTSSSASLKSNYIPDSAASSLNSSLKITELNTSPLKPQVKQKPKRLLEHLNFEILKFEKRETEILSKVIHSHGGSVVDNNDICIVPSNKPNPEYAHLDYKTVITEFAIERTLHYKQLMLNDMWSKPLLRNELPGLTGKQVSISGFTGVEMRHIVKILEILKAEFCETLTATRQLLVIGNPQARKIMYAKKWKIPIFTVSKLFKSIDRGVLSSFEDDLAFEEDDVAYEDDDEQAKARAELEKALNSTVP